MLVSYAAEISTLFSVSRKSFHCCKLVWCIGYSRLICVLNPGNLGNLSTLYALAKLLYDFLFLFLFYFFILGYLESFEKYLSVLEF